MSFENKHCAITTRLVYVVCNINELTGYNLIGTLWQFDANLNKKKAFTHLVRRQNFAVLNDLVGCFFFFVQAISVLQASCLSRERVPSLRLGQNLDDK